MISALQHRPPGPETTLVLTSSWPLGSFFEGVLRRSLMHGYIPLLPSTPLE